MGSLIRDGLLSITMFVAGLGGGIMSAPASPPVVVVRELVSLEPPHRGGEDGSDQWEGPSHPLPAATEPGVSTGPTPPPPHGSDSVEAALARSAWPPHLWPQLIAIAQCESGLDPLAVGDHGRAWGLLQIRADAHPWLARQYDLFTFDGNLAAAWALYQDAGGFGPWSCR